MKKFFITLAVAVALCGFTSNARAADEFFLVFTGVNAIPGDSVVDGHAGEIDVISFSMGVSNPSSNRTMSSGGAQSGRPQFSDIVIVKPIDKASPKLMGGCARGEHYGTVVLRAIRSNGPVHLEYCTVTLSDVMISSVKHTGGMVSDGASGSTGAMSEQVSLTFGKIQISYRSIDATGRLMPPVVSGWDVTRNTWF